MKWYRSQIESACLFLKQIIDAELSSRKCMGLTSSNRWALRAENIERFCLAASAGYETGSKILKSNMYSSSSNRKDVILNGIGFNLAHKFYL